jgi:hypothetical protein
MKNHKRDRLLGKMPLDTGKLGLPQGPVQIPREIRGVHICGPKAFRAFIRRYTESYTRAGTSAGSWRRGPLPYIRLMILQPLIWGTFIHRGHDPEKRDVPVWRLQRVGAAQAVNRDSICAAAF